MKMNEIVLFLKTLITNLQYFYNALHKFLHKLLHKIIFMHIYEQITIIYIYVYKYVVILTKQFRDNIYSIIIVPQRDIFLHREPSF